MKKGISLSLVASAFVRRQCFKHLMVFSTLVIKLFKLFKTLHVSASIGHPQVLKLFAKRVAVIFRYSCLFVPLPSVCLIPCCLFGAQNVKQMKNSLFEELCIFLFQNAVS
jgi:hypothetical protein